MKNSQQDKPQLQRLPDWLHRLNALVLQRLAVPFAWRVNDCLIFGADAVAAMVGHDALVELRQPCDDPAAAPRMLRRGGGLDAALRRAGLAPVPVAYARCGDLVHVQQRLAPEPLGCAAGTRPAMRQAVVQRHRVLAVCVGADVVAPGASGLLARPLKQAVAAWRV